MKPQKRKGPCTSKREIPLQIQERTYPLDNQERIYPLRDVILNPSADGRRMPALSEETAETLRCTQGDSMRTFAHIEEPVR